MLTTDLFTFVADSFTLVGFRLPQGPHLGGKLPHLLLVGSLDVDVLLVGAGDGEVVLVTRGSNACADGSIASAQKRIPIDASITGILDNLSVDGKFTFKK